MRRDPGGAVRERRGDGGRAARRRERRRSHGDGGDRARRSHRTSTPRRTDTRPFRIPRMERDRPSPVAAFDSSACGSSLAAPRGPRLIAAGAIVVARPARGPRVHRLHGAGRSGGERNGRHGAPGAARGRAERTRGLGAAMRRATIALGIVAILASSCGDGELSARLAATLENRVAADPHLRGEWPPRPGPDGAPQARRARGLEAGRGADRRRPGDGDPRGRRGRRRAA